MKVSTTSAWAAITGVAVGLTYAGWITQHPAYFYSAAGMFALIGIVDLIFIKQGKMTISERIREATPAWARYPIIFGSWLAAFLIGGLPVLTLAVVYTTFGHWHWR